MQIYQRGKRGTWWVRFTAPDHRRIHQSLGTTDKKQAAELADKLKSESWRVCRLGERPRRTWQEAVLRFLGETQHKRSQDKDIARLKWLDRYLGARHLDEVTADVLATIRSDILAGKTPLGGNAPANLNRYLSVIRTILRKAVFEWEWLDRAPVIRPMKEGARLGHDIRWLTYEKAMRLLDTLDSQRLTHTADKARLTLATGLRETNVTGLSWDRVDLSRHAAWIGGQQSKSGRAISVPLNDDATKVLQRWRHRHPSRVFVFKGKPVARANTKAWRDTLRSEGLRPHDGRHPDNFRWHDLRHTWASWHVMAGTPLEVLQRLGGWASLDMVMRYAHLAPGHIARYASNVSGPNLTQVAGGVSNPTRQRAYKPLRKKRKLVGPVGLEPTTKGFTCPGVSTGRWTISPP